jgi:hypothetical protein
MSDDLSWDDDEVRENPFAAPEAEVDEPRGTGDDALLPEPNRLAARAGIAWIRGGWALMQGSVLIWTAIGFVWWLILFVLSLIPLLGGFVQIFLMPVFIAGPMLACRAKERNEKIRFDHLFAGFSSRVNSLMALGLIYLLIAFLVFAFFGISFAVLVGFYNGMHSLSFTPLLLFPVTLVLFFIPMALVQWLSPQLLALHEEAGLTAWEAFKLAVHGIMRNLLPFMVFGLIGFVLPATIFVGIVYVLGSWALILMLSIFFLMPLGACIFYEAYRDIFVRPH